MWLLGQQIEMLRQQQHRQSLQNELANPSNESGARSSSNNEHLAQHQQQQLDQLRQTAAGGIDPLIVARAKSVSVPNTVALNNPAALSLPGPLHRAQNGLQRQLINLNDPHMSSQQDQLHLQQLLVQRSKLAERVALEQAAERALLGHAAANIQVPAGLTFSNLAASQVPPASGGSGPVASASDSQINHVLGLDNIHRSKQSFPEKIYFMLEQCEKEGRQDVISFVDNGTAFLIHKPRFFETDIMPLFFASRRMSSFQRQLNIYGFQRINEGQFRGAYRHKDFILGKKELLKSIKRIDKRSRKSYHDSHH